MGPSKPKSHHHPVCFTACFRPFPAAAGSVASPAAAEEEQPGAASLKRSSSTWLCSKAHDLHHHHHPHHRRRRSADFAYDSLSYALNFDDSAAAEEPLFSARLPASPPAAFEGMARKSSRSPISPA